MTSIKPEDIGLIRKRIIENSELDIKSACWNWILSKNSNGYGQIKFQKKMQRAHRVSFMAFNGEIPDGIEVMHKCDNRSCVNPFHLKLGTHQENMRDIVVKGRSKRGSEHPMYGRPGLKGSRSKQAKAVEINGIIYGGHNEAERALNVAHGSVKYWIKTGKAKEIGVKNGK